MNRKIKKTGVGFSIHKNIIYGLIIFGLIFGLSGVVGAACIGTTQNFECGDTVTQNCTLNNNLTSNGTCFTLGADDIVIDGDGYSITGNNTGYGINVTGKKNVTVKNFNIINFSHGIYLKRHLWNNVKHLGIYNGVFDYGASLGVNNYYSLDMQHRLGVATGERHTCILKSDGNVDCYGYNAWGQANDYSGRDAIGVSGGDYHTCVLKSNGNVDCYGCSDVFCNLGQASDYSGGDAIGVSAGGGHTCVLKSNGNVDCYGFNNHSQASDYSGGDAIGVSAGWKHTCILKSNGNVDCYGLNDYGQAGDYTGGDAIGVSAGGYHTCILKSNGNVDCYGCSSGMRCFGQGSDYTGGDAIGVSAGGYHTCILKSNGNADCYGRIAEGQSSDYSGGDAIGVSAGNSHTCILKSNGNVDCYGDNGDGQAGDYTGGDVKMFKTAGINHFIITNNSIFNCDYGIYSQHSNSIINSNTVCNNTNNDFDSSNWFSSFGDNNACDNPDGWNDYRTTGCTYTCTTRSDHICHASSCDDAEERLNDAICNEVRLDAGIANYAGTCINNPENFNNKTFDCQGYMVDGDDSGTDSGIYLNMQNNNTIKNCVIADFSYGIYLNSSSSNNIISNTASNNYRGIRLDSSSSNNIANNIVDNNGWYGIYLRSSSSNNITSNTVSNSKDDYGVGITLDYSSDNILTDNTVNLNGRTGIYLWNDSNLNKILDNEISDNNEGIRISDCDWWGVCPGGNTNNTLQGNEISNNYFIGIYSQNSTSTINSNIVCGNINYDFSSPDWKSSSGNNNTCDKPDGWSDTGTTGCTYICQYCSACDECGEKLNSTKLKDNTLYLAADIANYAGTCINNPENFNSKIFECQGHTIDGDGEGWNEYGIYLSGKSNNTIRNCIITGFYDGIYLNSSLKNTITNSMANNNDESGIYLNSSSNNTIAGNTVSSNTYHGIYLVKSSNNTITGNIANYNYKGISLWESSNNALTENTAKSNNHWGIVLWNNSNFNEISDNEISDNSEGGIKITSCEPSEDFCLGGNTNNTIQGNEISNNTIGIYSQNSNSTTNSNFVCGNINSDFSSPGWKSSSGNDNFCKKPDGWNDTGKAGCTYPCPCYCGSCSECEAKLNDPSCLYVMLNASIVNPAGSCINNPTNFVNKTFDCYGHKIVGDDNGTDYGIYLDGKSENTIKNCMITDFYYGIYLNDSAKNTFSNNKVYQNKGDGIHLDSSSNNNFSNNQMQYNEHDGIYFSSDSNNNRLTSNTVCSSTNFDINDEDSNVEGINNTCDKTNNYDDWGKNKCTHKCPAALPDLEVSKLYLYLPEPKNLQVCTEIKNPLKGTANNVTVNLYVDNILEDYKIVPSIGANSTDFVCLLWIAQSGTHDLRIVVDPKNLIEELYEDNNEVSKRIKSTVFCVQDSDCNDNNPETDDMCIGGVCNNIDLFSKKLIKSSPEINKATLDTTVHFYFIVDVVGSLCENLGGTVDEYYDNYVRENNKQPPGCKGVKVYMNIKSPTHGSIPPAEGIMTSNGLIDVPVLFKKYGDTGTYEISVDKITLIDGLGNTKDYNLLQKHYIFDVVEEEFDITTGIATQGYAKLTAGWEWGVTVGILKLKAGVSGNIGVRSEIPREYSVGYRGDDSFPYNDIQNSPLNLKVGRKLTAFAGASASAGGEATIIKDKLKAGGGVGGSVEVDVTIYDSDVFEFESISKDGPAFYTGSAMMVVPDPLAPTMPIYYNDIVGPGLSALTGLYDYQKSKTVGLSTGVKGKLGGSIGGGAKLGEKGNTGLGGEVSAYGLASARIGSEQIFGGSLLNLESEGFCSYNSLSASAGAGANVKLGYEQKKEGEDKKGTTYSGGIGVGGQIIGTAADNKICYYNGGDEEKLELTLKGEDEKIKYKFDADDISDVESNEINNIKDAYDGSIGKRAYLALLAGFITSDILNNMGTAEPTYTKSELNTFMYNLMLSVGLKAGVIGGEIGAGGKLFGGISGDYEKGIQSKDYGELPIYERPPKNYNDLEVLYISGLFAEKVYIEGVIDNLDDIALKIVSDLSGALTVIVDCIKDPGKCVQDVVTGAWKVITNVGGTIVSVLSKLKFWDQHIHVVDEYGREIYFNYSYREYLFSWDDVPDNNTELLKSLNDTLKIEWLNNATINKSADNTTITVADENNTLTFTLNETLNESENRVTLEINGIEGYDKYVSRYENGTRNIYLSGRFVNEIPGAFIIRTITEEQIANYTNSTNVTYHIHESVFIPEGIKFKVYIDAGEAHNITEPYQLVATTHDTGTNITYASIIEDNITQNETVQYTIDVNISKANGTVTNITTRIIDKTSEICGNGICNASANETIENCQLDCDNISAVIHSADIELMEDINKKIKIIVNASDNIVIPLVFVNASSSTGSAVLQMEYNETTKLYIIEFFALQSDIYNFTILAYDNVKKQPATQKMSPVAIKINVSDWYVKALNMTLPYNITYYQNNVSVDEIEGWNKFNVILNFANFTLEFNNVSAKRLQPTQLPIVFPALNVLLNETSDGEEITAKDELLYVNALSLREFFGENATYNAVLKMRKTDSFSDVIKCDNILFGRCINLQIIPEQNYSVVGEWIVMNMSSFSTYGAVNMQADLRPTTMVYAPKYLELNQNATILSVIENQGFVNATGVNISLFVDNNYYKSQIIDLSSLSQKTINFTWIVSSGIHNITIKADPNNEIDESDEDNNEISILMGISPDLKPDSIAYSNLIENKISNITAEIQNSGTVDANNTEISIIIDGTEINSPTVNISANSSVNVTFNWTATAAGIHNLTIAADPGNEINETNEENNNLTVQIFVEDAFVSDDAVLTAPPEVVLGEEFNILLFIKNTGTLVLENVSVYLILFSGFNTANATEIDVGNLSVGEERTVNWTLKGVTLGEGNITANITSNGDQINVVGRNITVLPCVNASDNLYINSSIILCKGVYNINDFNSDGAVIINSGDVILDCNNAALNGVGAGYGIINPGFDNVTIKNCRIINYDHGIYINNSNLNKILNNDILINNIGIYSADSGSEIFSNTVCGNINSDFDSPDWKSSFGDNNTCDKPDGWNDAGATVGGCGFSCLMCIDIDEDGYGVCPHCNVSSKCTYDGNDCSDTNDSINPGASEVCDGINNDCDETIDEDFTGLGESCTLGVGACEASGIYVCTADGTGTECDATPKTPSAEVCDGIDNDCNGTVDEGFATYTYYRDADNDTYGNAADNTTTCNATPPSGYVTNNTDCYDNNNLSNPGAAEVCDGIDNNCDGTKDEGCPSPGTSRGYRAPALPLPPAVCGNGACEGTENYTNCPEDCSKPIVCGDEVCDGNETYETCPRDCSKPIVCGDGTCGGDETCETCEADCGACPPVCGNGTCGGDETCETCEADCGACPKLKLMINCPEAVGVGKTTTCRVTDKEGDPVSASVVAVTMPDETLETFTTDENGNIQLTASKSGEIDAVASKEGYAESEKTRIYVIEEEKGCLLFDIKFIVCWYWWLLLLLVLILLFLFLKKKK